MSLAHKLLCRVSSKPSNAETSNTKDDMPGAEPRDQLKAFIAEDPDSRYTFDSERGAPQSEICREGREKGRKCITLAMHSTEMFAAMQAQGFFCALPMDPSRTHMECRRIPKA
ncbi:hypothetical protein WOLCODRAFT_149213 [Wolfiporia cocos MD-104 SS10]|uniref:Uncharacterized protein n=1 Tax=Wolfiporia cocos (strain MD-104) TaxID=742152 RepID=A0A2H3JQI3_WOLCO|nr:hypothetical protein WOLCODRAFT_149213 [Wolfiporia cocos MD-104 SS10]